DADSPFDHAILAYATGSEEEHYFRHVVHILEVLGNLSRQLFGRSCLLLFDSVGELQDHLMLWAIVLLLVLVVSCAAGPLKKQDASKGHKRGPESSKAFHCPPPLWIYCFGLLAFIMVFA